MDKRIFSRIIFIIGLGFFPPFTFECFGAQFRHEIYQIPSHERPLTFIYNGEIYLPPLLLSGTNAMVDRSTAESLAADYFSALKNKNGSLFNSLYAPDEQTTSLAAGPDDHVGWMSLKEKIYYGDYIIVTFEGQFNNQTASSCIALKKIGGLYYLTDKLIEDRLYNYYKSILQEPAFSFMVKTNAQVGGLVFQEKVYPFTNSAAQLPIVVEYCGTNYGTNYPMPSLNFDRDAQKLSSPEKANLAVYAAVFNTNLDWCFSLVCPDELYMPFNTVSGFSQTITNAIVKDILRSSRVLHLKSGLRICEAVYFGQYAFVASQSAEGGQDALTFKISGNQWLLTDELNRTGNVIRNFILGARSPDTVPFYPKVLP